jgi:fructoselysine-6-P-deglycase FrlB-like protein
MLDIDKKEVDFLVTDNMVNEVETIINRDFPKLDKILDIMERRQIEQVYFVACGSPLCACQTAELIFKKYSEIPCSSYSGWDFLDHTPKKLDKKCLVVGVSDSGATEEVGESLAKAKKYDALTLGFTKNSKGNIVAEEAEHLIAYEAECIWEIHLLLTFYIALNYIYRLEKNQEVKEILTDIKKLPSVLQKLLETVEKESMKLGKRASEWPFIYTISAGPLLPLAYKEGIITMLEFTWTHGSQLNAAEFRHGPLEVVEEGVPYLFLLGTDESRHTTKRALKFVKNLTDNYIVFDFKEISHGLHPMLAPFVMFVPLEYFYYYLSINKGHNPDDRRYYGGLMEY